MTERQEFLCKIVDKQRDQILEAERWLWAHPQTGFTEWEANEYLIEKFQALGYELFRADQDPKFGKTTGFFTTIDTGRPGPTLCFLAELDALDIANHPESVNGMAHSCGHHAQAATAYGMALALKEPGALDGLSGKIRIMLVPAEEMIQLEFRDTLRKQGVISYMGGKVEFLHRGYFEDVDMVFMFHAGDGGPDVDFTSARGKNGCMAKTVRFKGKSSHAGGAPHLGHNAQYAAMLGLQACNDLRETLQEKDYIRFHPIMMGVNCAVNIIPDEMKIESYVRGKTIEAMITESTKFNRAMTGAALAMGCGVELHDRPGYSPEILDETMMHIAEKACGDLVGPERVKFTYDGWGTGSADFGDLTCVMPGCKFFTSGIRGTGHGIDYYVDDINRLCYNALKAELFVADALLSNGAAAGKEVVANYKAPYASTAEYFKAVDQLMLDKDAVVYDENGNAKVEWK